MGRSVRLLREAAETIAAEIIYGPEEIRLMRAALDNSWSALAFVHFESEAEKRAMRERLARCILEETALGERSLHALSGRALGALEPLSAGGPQWHVSRFAS